MPTPRLRPEQPLAIRATHWLNVPLLVILAGSGLQILMAFPMMGPQGRPFRWFPLQGWTPPTWLRLGDWLAGARALHFGLGLLFVLNGALYLAYVLASGEWRRRLFWPPRDLGNALQTGLYYLRLRTTPPQQGLYNGLQRLGYTSALVLAILAVTSGLAMYKPVQLAWLAAVWGGYDGARVVHFASLAGLAAFTAGHLLMVALHPRTLLAMLGGGRRG